MLLPRRWRADNWIHGCVMAVRFPPAVVRPRRLPKVRGAVVACKYLAINVLQKCLPLLAVFSGNWLALSVIVIMHLLLISSGWLLAGLPLYP